MQQFSQESILNEILFEDQATKGTKRLSNMYVYIKMIEKV